MRVRIRHETRYRYEEPVLLGPQIVRLRPAEHTRARVLSYALSLPSEGEVRWQQDPWGNHIARLTLRAGERLRTLEVAVDLALEIRPVNPFDFFVDDRCRELPFAYPDGLGRELAPFLQGAHAKPGPRLATFLAEVPARGYVTDHLVAMNAKVASTVRYVIRSESGIQTSEETLTVGSGSCRDSAVLLCDALRAQGLATRFVSGYLVQLADEGNIPDLAKGVARDVVDLHAWCEVFVPGAGWIGLDGTSGLLAGEGHIPLACTVGPELAAPIEGTASGAQSAFEVVMEVERLGHEPSPRTPYRDEEWAAICATGERVDATLRECGLRLTMGGEPTWASREHAREPEWNEDALGATKWSQGLRLVRELEKRLGTGALLMHRMGKHYPGESLPRWVLHLLWRADGQPIWRTPALQDSGTADTDARSGATLADARAFATRLAARLGVDGSAICAGYEDPWIALVREQNLPDDLDPTKAKLSDSEDRRTLARSLSRGLGTEVGFVLPLARDDFGKGSPRWTTSTWTFRREHLFLLFGDSPMGLRLPLDRVTSTPVPSWTRDVTIAQLPLPPTGTAGDGATPAVVLPPGIAEGVVRTALCVEPRDGVLYAFLPPLQSAEAFLVLVTAIEDVAGELGRSVRLEGYGPPSDPRLQSCMVTPDPGVIEVNVPPTERFADYVKLMETLSTAANHAGLRPEKYRVDGREIGSGGGHHLTLGGPTTVESPFLRDPALFAGLLRYFNGHPSLSYTFTGLFVGPTSQAPRLDEARHDGLYELELALARAEQKELPTTPGLTDRLFRDLLVDVSGNGHRTEICIDKLYDPASLAGRQGLVEFRAFEMPPHERMTAAQMLLVRGIVARLAKQPYDAPLVRWGSRLHDRFMLPHYLWQDLREVVRDLNAHGLPLDERWYEPFVDYRFPVAGTLRLDDVMIELRTALEPWPVLGEEPGVLGGTSRYVDSSVERMQVRTEGLVAGRHLVLVNGFTLPLRETGRAGEQVAGVRFRAWQPPRSLQPHLGVHHPLRIDVVDTWGKRSLGACTYHVWHPEGRAYAEPPLTAFEAAARRAQRFTTLGHAPYPVVPRPAHTHDEQPHTLDLRRFDGDRRLTP